MLEHKEHFHGSDLEKIENTFGIKKENIISFSANVNPLGVSPELRTELAGHIDAITSYPDREYTELRKSIGAYCGCDYKNVIVGNGCTELISLFIQITAPQKALLLGPTYSEYERELKLCGGSLNYFFLKEEEDFLLDVPAFLQEINAETDLVIICNPNNPTSSALSHDKMEQILKHCQSTGTYVRVDETYVEFAPDIEEISAVSFLDTYDNLIILRGTSKFFAAPGLRLGYAMTHNEHLIQEINTNKNPWMINSLAVVAGITMFSDTDYIQKSTALAQSERKRLTKIFSESGKYKVYPSYGNFILLKILDEEVTSSDLFEKAIKKGLMIRDCSTFPTLSDRYIRMCFMKPEDNDKLVRVLLE